MRFLLDECCPRALADALRGQGHDVVHVVETARGSPDIQLAALAEAEDRLIVTEDFDFGELAVRQATPRTGVVIIFCRTLLPAENTARAVHVIEEFGKALAGHLTIIEAERVRRRPI
ncbi:MAG: DUF5615 family PIN-like protein [Pseudomonadota bacterium]